MLFALSMTSLHSKIYFSQCTWWFQLSLWVVRCWITLDIRLTDSEFNLAYSYCCRDAYSSTRSETGNGDIALMYRVKMILAAEVHWGRERGLLSRATHHVYIFPKGITRQRINLFPDVSLLESRRAGPLYLGAISAFNACCHELCWLFLGMARTLDACLPACHPASCLADLYQQIQVNSYTKWVISITFMNTAKDNHCTSAHHYVKFWW